MVALVNRVMENVGGFLCLSRKTRETILAIDDRDGSVIEFEMGDIHSNRAGVRIRAPRHIRIVRGELLPRIEPQRAA